MNGNMFKAEIERVFREARKTCPNITDDMLDNNGAIYYANANDGTSFDWSCNNRLCEFFIYHKNGIGFIKALVYRDNTIVVYIYEDAGQRPTNKLNYELKDLKASDFAKLMDYIADNNSLWDKSINELNWDIDTDDCYCYGID